MEWVTLFSGAVIALGSTGLQQWWSRQNLWTTLAAKRDEEVRVRADEKAVDALDAVERLRTVLLRRGPILGVYRLPGMMDDRYAEYKDALAVLTNAAVFFQQPLREHVRAAAAMVPEVDQLCGERWVQEWPHTVLWRLFDETHDRIGAYLRNEPVEPASAQVLEYRRALAELEVDINRRLAAQEAADGDATNRAE